MNCSTTTSRIQWLLTIAGLSGIASIFLPFTPFFISECAPIGVVAEFMSDLLGGLEGLTPSKSEVNIGLLGIPFLLAFVITASLIRWNLTGRLSLLEQIITYLIGFLMMVVVISSNFRFSSYGGKMSVVFSVNSLIAGIFLTIRNHRIGNFKNLSPIMLMQTAYLSHGIFCLIAVWRHWQIGAYFTLATVIIYLAQMIWISCQKKEISAKEQITELLK